MFPPPSDPAAPRRGAEPPYGPVPPILVVDDVAAHARRTRQVLETAGYAVVTEPDGDAVLALVHGRLVRLVVSELYIGCDEGRCVVAAVKEERTRLPRLHVVVYTRHAGPADVAWALDAGCNAVVMRPPLAAGPAASAADAALLREVQRLDEVGGIPLGVPTLDAATVRRPETTGP